MEGQSCTTKATLSFCRSLVELLSRSQSHLQGSVPGLLATLLSPGCPQRGQGWQPAPTDAPALRAASPGSAGGCLRGHQPLGFTSERGWSSEKAGFVFAKTTKVLRFSSIPTQLAFWWLVGKHSVMVYFGKTHLSPGMGTEGPGKKTLLHLGALPERPRPPTTGVKQHGFSEGNPAMANLHQLRIQAFVSLKT